MLVVECRVHHGIYEVATGFGQAHNRLIERCDRGHIHQHYVRDDSVERPDSEQGTRVGLIDLAIVD